MLIDGLKNKDNKIKSFLLIGQSNMAGRGEFNEVPKIDNPNCYMLRMGRWQKMSEPINPDRAIFDEKFHSGIIFEIKRFAVHDGDGIRTTVFFKGCPLKCVWCHNPESLSNKPELAYYKNKCVNCGECVSVCKVGAHSMVDGVHVLDRNKCVACGKCEDVCLGNALKFYGKKMSVEDVLSVILLDKEFYLNSGGGVTLSGGECLCQADFCTKLLKSLKEKGIHTAVDTCGYAPRETLDKIMPYTDVFLYDVKGFDDSVHIKNTGKSNTVILENLLYLDKCGKNIEIRIPYVPKYNDKDLERLSPFINSLKNVTKVKILPYHNFAGSKYLSLGFDNTLPNDLPDKESLEKIERLFTKT